MASRKNHSGLRDVGDLRNDVESMNDVAGSGWIGFCHGCDFHSTRGWHTTSHLHKKGRGVMQKRSLERPVVVAPRAVLSGGFLVDYRL